MSLFFNTTTQNGTDNDDFMFGDPSAGPNHIINGNGGNDVIFGDYDFFVRTFGTSAVSPVNITNNIDLWSTTVNPDVSSSTTVAHAAVYFEALSDVQPWYAVTATAGSTITLDIDYGANPFGAGVDTVVQIFTPDGATILASGDDSPVLAGARGSAVSYDSLLQYTFESGGTYLIKIEKFGEDVFHAGEHLMLNISLTGQAFNNQYPTFGDDTLNGGAGNDILYGMLGSDTIDGGADDDYIDGGPGVDLMRGGAGNDTYVVDSPGDVVDEVNSGGAGYDLVRTSISFSLRNSATLMGQVENLTLLETSTALNATGNDLVNILIGNGYANVLNGGELGDTMRGGGGADIYYVDSVLDTVDEQNNNGAGIDTVRTEKSLSLVNSGHMLGQVENLTLLASSTALNATGNALSNVLTGNAYANVLDGGGLGDTMRGGGGGDTYYVNSALDVVDEQSNGGAGIDTVRSSISLSLLNPGHMLGQVENLTLLGASTARNATGNGLANVLTGNAYANVLAGGGGNDKYYVNTALDTVDEQSNGGSGVDTILSSVSLSLANSGHVRGKVENLTLLASSTALNATGNGLANALTGNAYANTLAGGVGIDTIRGGLGNDHFVFNAPLAPAFHIVPLSGFEPGTGSREHGKPLTYDPTPAETSLNRDVIVDFSNASGNNDRFKLENAVMGALGGAGNLNPLFFHNGTKATDANHHIIYNQSTGALIYDPNGLTSGGAIQIATLSNHVALTASDFVVI